MKLTYEDALEAQQWLKVLLNDCCQATIIMYSKLWAEADKVIKKHDREKK